MSRHSIGWALYRNELEKLWAHRARVLLIAFILIVLGGSFIVYNSHQSAKTMQRQTIAMMQSQVATLHHQIKQSSGTHKAMLVTELKGDEQGLRQMTSQHNTLNVASQIKMLKTELKHSPLASQGPDREELAQYQSMASHGIRSYNPNAENGFRLAGQVFSNPAMMVFALLAVGLAADRISSEVEGGTLGGLLLHAPYRLKVYLAKLLASLTVIWGFMAAAAVGFFIAGSAFFGSGSAQVPHVVGIRVNILPGSPAQVQVPVQTFHLLPQWSYDLLSLALAMIAMGALVAIALMISILTRSTVIALIIGALLVVSGALSHLLGFFAAWDPVVQLPLMADWTRKATAQFSIHGFSLESGLMVVFTWTAAAIVVGLWYAQRLDV